MTATDRIRTVVLLVAACATAPAWAQADTSRVDVDGPYRSKMRIVPPRTDAALTLDPAAALNAAGDDPYARALVLRSLGYTAASAGDHAQAVQRLREALDAGALAPVAQAQIRSDLIRLWAADNADQPLTEAYLRWRAQGHSFDATEHLSAARALGRQSRHAAALDALRDALALTPQPPAAWREFEVYLLAQLQRFAEAARVQAQRLDVAAASRADWTNLVGLLSAADDHAGALAATELAVEYAAFDRAEDLDTLALLYVHSGLPDHAAYLLQTALDNGTLSPTPARWRLLARARLNAGDKASAVAPLAALAAATDLGSDHFVHGQLLHQLGRYAQAVTSLERALLRDAGADRGRALLMLGEAQLALGNVAAARRAWTRAADVGGSYRQARALLDELARAQPLDAPAPEPPPTVSAGPDDAPPAAAVPQELARKNVPRQRFFFIAERMTAAELPAHTQRMTRLLRNAVRRERLSISGPVQFIALGDPQDAGADFELQVGVPVRSRVPPRGSFQNRDTLPFDCVYRQFRGTAGELAPVWLEFATTTVAAGLTPTGETRTVLLEYAPADGRHLFELQVGVDPH